MLGPGTVQTPPLVSAPVTVSTRRGVTEGSVRDALDIEALSHQYGAMVLRRCRRLLGDEDEALDACQDVFVRVLERRERLDAAYPSSLLFRIATNVCLNRIRDRGRRPATRDEALLASIACAESPGAGERGQADPRLAVRTAAGVQPDDRGAALRRRSHARGSRAADEPLGIGRPKTAAEVTWFKPWSVSGATDVTEIDQ